MALLLHEEFAHEFWHKCIHVCIFEF